MIRKVPLFLLVALVSTMLLGCSSDDASNACSVKPPNTTASADGTVTYSAVVEGTGSIDSLDYTADSKNVTVKNPDLPFSVSIDVKANDPISISAVGSASNGGKLTVGYAFVDDAGSDPAVTSAQCSH